MSLNTELGRESGGYREEEPRMPLCFQLMAKSRRCGLLFPAFLLFLGSDLAFSIPESWETEPQIMAYRRAILKVFSGFHCWTKELAYI